MKYRIRLINQNTKRYQLLLDVFTSRKKAQTFADEINKLNPEMKAEVIKK